MDHIQRVKGNQVDYTTKSRTLPSKRHKQQQKEITVQKQQTITKTTNNNTKMKNNPRFDNNSITRKSNNK